MASINLENRAVMFLFLMVVSVKVSDGAVYEVGDLAGWTIKGNVDYKQWASNKTFHLGDIIFFSYNPQYHNVMRVTHAEYRACNVSSPISTYTSGNDSITMDTYGHHFFLCGAPGHCQAGQKVDINIIRASSVGPSPSAWSPTPVTSPVPTVTMPAASRATRMVNFEKFGWLLMLLQLFNVFCLA